MQKNLCMEKSPFLQENNKKQNDEPESLSNLKDILMEEKIMLYQFKNNAWEKFDCEFSLIISKYEESIRLSILRQNIFIFLDSLINYDTKKILSKKIVKFIAIVEKKPVFLAVKFSEEDRAKKFFDYLK